MGANRRERIAGALFLALVVTAAIPAHGDAPSAPAQAQGGKKKREKPPPPPPLDGASYEFDYDGADVGRPERAWQGRVFVHRLAAAVEGPLPILIFLHGT